MNVYDFDGTIYDGESSFDFFMYCLPKRPALLPFLHKFCINLVKYKLCLIDRQQLKDIVEDNFHGLFKACPDYKELTEKFWDKNEKRIKAFYKKQQKDDDVIISASFDFLLEPICQRLGIKNLICSSGDTSTGKITRLCFRENKLSLFKEHFPHRRADNFYTDSLNDASFADFAEKSWLVKKNKIIPFK